MKISTKLPQFINERALLVITGKQGAEFYVAKNGQVAMVESFTIPLPKYSDHEGKFIRRGRGRVSAGGAVYEFDKSGMTKGFLRILTERVKQLVANYNVTATYLYAPMYLMKQVKSTLARTIEESYVMSFRGNYHGRHPFEFLEMIAARRKRRATRRHVVPTKREAAKILGRS